MTCYPNCGTTTTTFETAQHVVGRTITHHALAFTGSDVVGWVVLAVVLIAVGALLLWACRAGWRRLG